MAQNKRKPQQVKKSSMRPFYYALGAIALLGAILIGMTMLKNSKAATEPPQMAAQSPADLVAQARGVIRGNPDAPVKLMVFSDYMCPGCAQFATTIEPQMRAEYGDRISEVYHDYPLVSIHQYSFLAARAGRCAEDQGKFWEYHDMLFAKQRDWSFVRSAPFKEFNEYATAVGLDAKAFDACLKSEKHADLISANLQLGQTVGVPVTPTVYINGKRAMKPMDWSAIKADIDAALGIK